MEQAKAINSKIIFVGLFLIIMGLGLKATIASQVDTFYTDLLKRGEQSYLDGNYTDAIREFEVAAFGLYNEKNLLTVANLYLSLCYYALNDLEKCKKYLSDTETLTGDAGLESVPINEEAKDDLELLLFYLRPEKTNNPELNRKSSEELEQEIRELDEQIKTEPDNKKLYFDLYERYLKVKDFKEARKTIEKLLKINPREIEGYYLIGVAHYKEGKYDDSVDDFNRFFQHSMNVEVENNLLMNARAYLIISYYKNGEPDKSFEVMRQAPDIFTIQTVKTLSLDRNDKILLLNILEISKKEE